MLILCKMLKEIRLRCEVDKNKGAIQIKGDTCWHFSDPRPPCLICDIIYLCFKYFQAIMILNIKKSVSNGLNFL